MSSVAVDYISNIPLFSCVGDAGLNTTMVVYFTRFRRILLHKQAILPEEGLVEIPCISKGVCIIIEFK